MKGKYRIASSKNKVTGVVTVLVFDAAGFIHDEKQLKPGIGMYRNMHERTRKCLREMERKWNSKVDSIERV